MTAPLRGLASRLAEVVRFGLVGGAATAVHAGAAWGMVALGDLPPLLAGFLAWACAVGVSFVGHRWFSFRTTCAVGPALVRLIIVSILGCVAHLAVLQGLLWNGMAAQVAVVVATAVVPLVSYPLCRWWVFPQAGGSTIPPAAS